MLEKGTECLKKRNVFLVLVLIGILAVVFLGVRSKQNNIMSHENVKNGFFCLDGCICGFTCEK